MFLFKNKKNNIETIKNAICAQKRNDFAYEIVYGALAGKKLTGAIMELLSSLNSNNELELNFKIKTEKEIEKSIKNEDMTNEKSKEILQMFSVVRKEQVENTLLDIEKIDREKMKELKIVKNKIYKLKKMLVKEKNKFFSFKTIDLDGIINA